MPESPVTVQVRRKDGALDMVKVVRLSKVHPFAICIEGCTAPVGAAVIEVAPGRCELCGGSEIQRAATRFIQACETAGISRVRFVGGSPNYRTQLEALFPGRGPLTVRTTAGARRSGSTLATPSPMR